jgi:hypothetical protein
MNGVATPPPPAAALENGDGTANIYVTADPSVNKVTLTVTNGTGGVIGVPAGQPVPDDKLPSGSSAAYLFFDGLLPTTRSRRSTSPRRDGRRRRSSMRRPRSSTWRSPRTARPALPAGPASRSR